VSIASERGLHVRYAVARPSASDVCR